MYNDLTFDSSSRIYRTMRMNFKWSGQTWWTDLKNITNRIRSKYCGEHTIPCWCCRRRRWRRRDTGVSPPPERAPGAGTISRDLTRRGWVISEIPSGSQIPLLNVAFQQYELLSLRLSIRDLVRMGIVCVARVWQDKNWTPGAVNVKVFMQKFSASRECVLQIMSSYANADARSWRSCWWGVGRPARVVDAYNLLSVPVGGGCQHR